MDPNFETLLNALQDFPETTEFLTRPGLMYPMPWSDTYGIVPILERKSSKWYVVVSTDLSISLLVRAFGTGIRVHGLDTLVQILYWYSTNNGQSFHSASENALLQKCLDLGFQVDYISSWPDFSPHKT